MESGSATEIRYAEASQPLAPPVVLGHIQWRNLVSGILGGSLNTVIFHPLDLAKIRLQVNEGSDFVKTRPRSSHFIGTLREVYRSKGFFGLYQGAAPNLIGNATCWGLYFLFYEALKSYAQDGDTSKKLRSREYFIVSAVTGLGIHLLTNPIWLAKTRMCLQYETLGNPRLTTLGTLASVWRAEGLRGLYRGFLPGSVGIFNAAIQFLAYEELRNAYNVHYHCRPIDTHLKGFEYVIIGGASKAIATTLTYPHQVVRTRLQEQHRHYKNLTCLVKSIWVYEGARGFYKGLAPALMRTAPSNGLLFLVYEKCRQLLNA